MAITVLGNVGNTGFALPMVQAYPDNVNAAQLLSWDPIAQALAYLPQDSALAQAVAGAVYTTLAASSGSSLIGFLQNGTGAVLRTVQDKDREIRSATDHGADPSGVQDSTLRLQSILDYLGSLPRGGTLVFPDGAVFKTSSKLNLYSNITLQGNAKIVCSSTIAIEALAKTRIRIYDLEIVGPGAAVVPLVPEDGGINIGNVTSSNGCSDVIVENCTVHEFYTGISARYGTNVRVLDNEIYNYTLYGVMLSRSTPYICSRNVIHDSVVTTGTNSYCISATGASSSGSPQKNCSITDNKLYNSPAWSGIMTHDQTQLVISGNVIENVRNGIDMTLSANTTISNVVISGNQLLGTSTDTWGGAAAGNSGIFVANGGTLGVDTIQSVAITGNVIRNFGLFNTGAQAAAGILASSLYATTITGNVITQPDGIASFVGGIFIGSDSKQLAISGNVINTNAKPPVYIANVTGSDISVVGNVLRAVSTAAAVRVENSTIVGFTVQGNRHNNALSGYTEAGTNVIDGVSVTAPFGGRGTGAHLSQRLQGAAVTSLAAGATTTLATVTLPGVVVGDTVSVGYAGQAPGVIVYGYVIGANSARVELYNGTGAPLTIAASTVSIDVWKHS